MKPLVIGLAALVCAQIASHVGHSRFGWKSWIYPAPFILAFWILLDVYKAIP